MAGVDLQPVFERLRAVMAAAAPDLEVKAEAPDNFVLQARWTPASKAEPMWFGAVTLKSYVAYHLMPVYTHPELAETISPGLRQRMQGKSCFNFKTVDEPLFAELATLTAKGAAIYATPF